MTPRGCSQPRTPGAATWASALSVNMIKNAKNKYRHSYCQISYKNARKRDKRPQTARKNLENLALPKRNSWRA